MKAIGKAVRVCATIAACALLSQCAPRQSVSVTNNYAKPIERVVIKDAKGIACSLQNIAPSTTTRCPDHAYSEGKVTYEVTAADFTDSGLLGFVNAGGSVGFTLEITRNGKVSTGETSVGFALGQK